MSSDDARSGATVQDAGARAPYANLIERLRQAHLLDAPYCVCVECNEAADAIDTLQAVLKEQVGEKRMRWLLAKAQGAREPAFKAVAEAYELAVKQTALLREVLRRQPK